MATDGRPPSLSCHAAPVVLQIKWANSCTGRAAMLCMCVLLALKPWQTRRKEREREYKLQKLSFSVLDQKCAAGKSTHIGARLARVARKVSSTANFSKSYAPREDAVRRVRPSEAFMMTFHRFSNQEKLIHRRRRRRNHLAHLLIQH